MPDQRSSEAHSLLGKAERNLPREWVIENSLGYIPYSHSESSRAREKRGEKKKEAVSVFTKLLISESA